MLTTTYSNDVFAFSAASPTPAYPSPTCCRPRIIFHYSRSLFHYFCGNYMVQLVLVQFSSSGASRIVALEKKTMPAQTSVSLLLEIAWKQYRTGYSYVFQF